MYPTLPHDGEPAPEWLVTLAIEGLHRAETWPAFHRAAAALADHGYAVLAADPVGAELLAARWASCARLRATIPPYPRSTHGETFCGWELVYSAGDPDCREGWFEEVLS